MGCPSGMIEIDMSAINSGIKIHKRPGSGTTATIPTITGTISNIPILKTTVGINLNYEAIVFDFDNSFFVALYD
jgi:hypothetical protein